MTKFKRTLGALAVISPLGASPTAFAQGHGHGGHGHGHSHGHDHGHGKENALEVEPGPAAPSVEMTVTKDAVAGWNVHIKTVNFRFAPENASSVHVAGEGHAHLYVDDKKIDRVYGSWFHIDKLSENGAEVRVTLNTNDHRDIMVGGMPVKASQAVGKAMKHGQHN